ncbi:MAG: hypothetical protein U1D55_19430 [Phycisphaerae bacterium]
MRSTEMIAAMAEQGLWTSPNGKTPHATLYAAILREISAQGRRGPLPQDRSRVVRIHRRCGVSTHPNPPAATAVPPQAWQRLLDAAESLLEARPIR